MSNDRHIVNTIIGRYAVFMLSGFNITNIKIKVGTIRGYLSAVNDHYEAHGYEKPYVKGDKSDADKLLSEQKKFEGKSAKRSPLNDKMIVKMQELAQEDPLGFKAAVFEFTALGRFGGFRQQEFCMDSKTVIKYYVLPNGTAVVRAFTVKNFIFLDEDACKVMHPLQQRDLNERIATEYDLQKNRMNGQILSYARLPFEHRAYCPVVLGLNIVARAEVLGNTEPEDPLCVYRDEKGMQYLTSTEITKYFRTIMKLVMPNISDEELKLISTHSIRVYACVLLSEAGKDGPYIKLRLRWLSNCFEIYLRNTNIIADQHNEALDTVHTRMCALAISASNLYEIVHTSGAININMNDLEDED